MFIRDRAKLIDIGLVVSLPPVVPVDVTEFFDIISRQQFPALCHLRRLVQHEGASHAGSFLLITCLDFEPCLH